MCPYSLRLILPIHLIPKDEGTKLGELYGIVIAVPLGDGLIGVLALVALTVETLGGLTATYAVIRVDVMAVNTNGVSDTEQFVNVLLVVVLHATPLVGGGLVVVLSPLLVGEGFLFHVFMLSNFLNINNKLNLFFSFDLFCN